MPADWIDRNCLGAICKRSQLGISKLELDHSVAVEHQRAGFDVTEVVEIRSHPRHPELGTCTDLGLCLVGERDIGGRTRAKLGPFDSAAEMDQCDRPICHLAFAAHQLFLPYPCAVDVECPLEHPRDLAERL